VELAAEQWRSLLRSAAERLSKRGLRPIAVQCALRHGLEREVADELGQSPTPEERARAQAVRAEDLVWPLGPPARGSKPKPPAAADAATPAPAALRLAASRVHVVDGEEGLAKMLAIILAGHGLARLGIDAEWVGGSSCGGGSLSVQWLQLGCRGEAWLLDLPTLTATPSCAAALHPRPLWQCLSHMPPHRVAP